MIFVDTSALLAVIDKPNQQHEIAFATWRELIRRDEHLVTSNYTVVELFSLAQKRIGLDAGLMHRRIDPDDLEQRDDVALECDCASFVVMNHRGLRTAFTLDRHFAEQGFATIP